MKFKSLTQLLDYFKDEATCIKYYEQARWNGNPTCPHCNTGSPYITNRGYRCKNCDKKFTVKIGTVYENSKIPFRLWFAAIYLFTSKKKGVNSVDLSKTIGVTQKTAWFMLHRIREMMKDKAPERLGAGNRIVEIDETYVGGKEKNRHLTKKLASPATNRANDGTPYNKKKTVIGMIERNGNVVLKFVPDATHESIIPLIEKYIWKGGRIMTDEFSVYKKLDKTYCHESVNHSQGQYVDGHKHTNTIENFWSVLKRGLYGTYQTVSNKHMTRYLNEYSFKFNLRHNHHSDTFHHILENCQGGILYKNLTA